jgi:hypothetical protein
MDRSRVVVSAFAALYFSAVAALTFVSAPDNNGNLWVWTLFAFIPVGAFLVCMFGRNRWWLALAYSMAAAAWLEAAQTVWMPAGYGTVLDILIASIGAGIGVGGAVGMSIWRERSVSAHRDPAAESTKNLSVNRRASASNSAPPLNLDR